MSSFFNSPDEHGLFGDFGGQYVAETLMPLILELGREYEKAKDDPDFIEKNKRDLCASLQATVIDILMSKLRYL